MSYNQNSGYGAALLNRLYNVAASVCPTFGRVLVVMSPDDSADPNFQALQEICKVDNEGAVRFYTDLEDAYDAVTTNNNDVILLDGHSTHILNSGQLTVSKNRTHFVGMDGGERLHGQGAKIQNIAGTAAISVVYVTGTRNTFRNIKFIQNDDEATSLNVLKEAGESTLYKNCSFIFGDVDNLDQTNAYEILMSGDSTEFHNCTFGADTLVTSAARAVVAFDVITTAAKSSVWKDCVWNILSSSADANFIRVVATTDLHFGHIFINPVFLATISNASSAITLTDAVDSVSGLNAGNMLMINPATNCTNLSSAASDNLKVVAMGDAATTLAGIGITPA